MSDAAMTAPELASVWLPMTVIASMLAMCAYPAFRRVIANCRPALRASATLGYGLLPAVVAVAAMFLVMHPVLSAMMVPAHCHHGACASHAPVFSVSSLGGLSLVTGGSLLFIAVCIVFGLGIRNGRRRLLALRSFSRNRRDRGWRVIDSPDWLAWCCGLWRTEVVLSSGLLKELTPSDLDVIVAHEYAHAARRDNLRALLLNWSTLFWLPALRTAIRNDMADDAEQACDAVAVDVTGSRDIVATVIETLQARWPQTSAKSAAAFAACDAPGRIAAIRNETQPAAALRAVTGLSLMWCFLLVLMTAVTHVLVEWVSALGT